MPDEYQFGSDKQWLEHSNEELARLYGQQKRRAQQQRTVIFILLVLLGFVVFRFHQEVGLRQLWRLPFLNSLLPHHP